MCDCQYCQEVRSRQAVIDRMNDMISRIDEVNEYFNTVNSSLVLTKNYLAVFMKADNMIEMQRHITQLDDDLKSAKGTIVSRLYAVKNDEETKRNTAQDNADAYHRQLEEAEKRRQEALRAKTDQIIQEYVQ